MFFNQTKSTFMSRPSEFQVKTEPNLIESYVNYDGKTQVRVKTSPSQSLVKLTLASKSTPTLKIADFAVCQVNADFQVNADSQVNVNLQAKPNQVRDLKESQVNI